MISSVFFLGPSAGRVLLSCGDERDPKVDDVCFEFASTNDSGETWSIVHPRIVDSVTQADFSDWTGYSGAAFLYFADVQHGWAILKRNLPSGRSSGAMLRTLDGGLTWTQLPDNKLPMAEDFHFINTKDGWIGGGPNGEIYATHDAGDSWERSSLAKPEGVGLDTGVEYSLPTFESRGRGFLTARYAVGPLLGPDLSTVVLLTTGDGGATWREDRTLPGVPVIYSSDVTSSALVAAHSELAKTVGETTLSLYSVGSDRSVLSNTSNIPWEGAVTHLAFVSQQRGWANISGRLLSTEDGGKTWAEVTPGGPPPKLPSIRVPAKTTPLPIKGGEHGAAWQPSSGSGVSAHLAFDRSNVPTITQMSTWLSGPSLSPSSGVKAHPA